MKRFLKIVALVLVLSTVLSLSLPAFAKGKPTFHYVTLGASNSNGYALHGYLTEELYANPSLKPEDGGPGLSGYRTTPDYSYPALIRDYLISLGYEVDQDQLAQSTMRVEELRFLLDDSFTPDEYTKWRFYDEEDSGTWWFNCLDEMRADYRQSIAEADLITYDMGLNNFGVYVMNRLISGDYDADFSHIFGTELAERFYILRDKLHAAVESLTQGAVTGDAIGELESLVDTLAYALLGYCVHFDATMGAIRRLNPDADIVVMSVQNVMMDIEAELMGFTLPLGAIFGAFVDIANAYTSIGSPYSKTYFFADTRENGRVTYFMDELAAYNGDPATLTQDMIDCYNVYDTSLPFYLKFRVAKTVAVAKGLCADCSEREFKTRLPEFVALCEENCPEEYETALTRTYDVITTLFQSAILTRPLDVTGLADGSADMGAIEDQLMADILAAANDTALASLEGREFTDEEIDALISSILSDPSVAAVASIGIRASIGNTFYSHPSRRGHEELAEAILLAWKGSVSGRQAFIKAAVEAKQQIITMSVRYGIKAVYTLLDKVGEVFGIDEKTSGFLGLFVPDADDVIKLVIRKIGYGDADGMNRLLEVVQETAAELGAHSLKKVAAKEATILHSGNIEYYICPDCGKLFIDAAGMIPIADPDSVVIPRITLISAIKSLFR